MTTARGRMKPVAPSSLDAQLFGLGTLVQLLKRARRAATAEELGFVMVNETHALLPYRQAALWQRHARGRRQGHRGFRRGGGRAQCAVHAVAQSGVRETG